MTATNPALVQFRGQLDIGIVSVDGQAAHSWTSVRIPFQPLETWPQIQKLRVRGTVNGTPFRTSLIHLKKEGSYIFLVTRILQKKARLQPGCTVDIVIEPDLEDRSASPPPQLAKLFKEDRAVKKWFDKLNYSTRKYICDQVAERKTPEAAQRRAEFWVECCMLTMEGEVEPPPILQIAFRRQPLARIGWESMTPNQRRNNLFGIFMTQSPEARLKRTDYAIEEALKVARRKQPK